MTRKEKEFEFKRNLMLDSARILFLKNGFDQTTIKDIAIQSEFSRVTIYKYFKSKMDILLPILFEALYDNYKKYDAEIRNSKYKTNYDKLKYFGLHYYSFFKNKPEYHQVIMQFHKHKLDRELISKRNYEIMLDSHDFSQSVFRRILTDGIETGEFRRDIEIDIAIRFFLKSTFAIIHEYIYNPDFPLQELDLEMTYLLKAFIR